MCCRGAGFTGLLDLRCNAAKQVKGPLQSSTIVAFLLLDCVSWVRTSYR
jgi:hypothetical protein